MNCRYAASMWIWSDSLAREADIFQKISNMGFDGVEIPSMDGKIDAKKVRDDLRNVGRTLEPIIIGGGSRDTDFLSDSASIVSNGQEYVKRLVDRSSDLGGALVCGPLYSAVGTRKYRSESERVKAVTRIASDFKSLARYASDRSVRIALEPLCRYDTSILNTSFQARELVDRIDAENVGILLDTFHMNIEEKSVEDAIRKAGNKLFHFHACENDRGAPGSGLVDWLNVRNALRELKYTNWISIESFGPDRGEFSSAMNVWRHFEPSQDDIAANGLAFLKKLFVD